VLPGIYGAGRNWATVARRLVAARPDWGVVLVDLRQHGASQGFAPPHTLEAAAGDIVRLTEATGKPAAAVLGHSFGGKVALEFARQSPHGLYQVWVVDSTPEAGEPRGSAWTMLAHLKAMPVAFRSRDQAIQELVQRGMEMPVAQWMATNLERSGTALRWRFDLPSLEAMLLDFFRTPLWDVVQAPPGDAELHFVKAAASSVMAPDVVQRIEQAHRRVQLHRLDGGHWLNADNPEGVVALLREHLPHDGSKRSGARTN
jgi:pimeloyl-ACP methyl ester carboxylesterase